MSAPMALAEMKKALPVMRELCELLTTDPSSALPKLLETAAEVRTIAEGQNYLYCVGMISELETELTEISKAFVALSGRHKTDELFIFQFFVSDVVQNMEGYFTVLENEGSDSEEQVSVRLPSVRMLKTWRPTEDATLPVAAPAAAACEAPVAPLATSTATSTVTSTAATLAAPVQAAAPMVVESKPASTVAAAVAAPVIDKAAASANERRLYLMCKSRVTRGEKASFAIPIQQVTQVIISQPIIALPSAPEGLLGILNLRGETVPILHCKDREECADNTGKDYIVIARVGEKLFGFRMEEVHSVSDLNPSTFQEARDLVSHENTSWVTHLAQKDDDIVLIMDLSRALVA